MVIAKSTIYQKYVLELFISLYHNSHMIKTIIVMLLGILSIAVSINTGTIIQAIAQSSMENSSNLTSRNNPSVTIGEILNGTDTQENASNESDSNFGLI